MDDTFVDSITQLALDGAKGEASKIEFKDGRVFVATTDNVKLQDLTLPHAMPVPQPQFITQAVAIQTVSSLIAYTTRFKEDGRTAIFADLDAGVLVSAIDYHKQSGEKAAGLRRHNAELKLRPSLQWTKWTKVNNNMMEQAAFAEFITENGRDMVLPDGWANLQELILDMEGEETIRVAKRMKRAHSGAGRSSAAIESTTTELPPEITVHIPVFFGEEPVAIRTFLRDKVDPSGLYIGFRLIDMDAWRQSELTRIANDVGAATGVPVFIGKTT